MLVNYKGRPWMRGATENLPSSTHFSHVSSASSSPRGGAALPQPVARPRAAAQRSDQVRRTAPPPQGLCHPLRRPARPGVPVALTRTRTCTRTCTRTRTQTKHRIFAFATRYTRFPHPRPAPPVPSPHLRYEPSQSSASHSSALCCQDRLCLAIFGAVSLEGAAQLASLRSSDFGGPNAPKYVGGAIAGALWLYYTEGKHALRGPRLLPLQTPRRPAARGSKALPGRCSRRRCCSAAQRRAAQDIVCPPPPVSSAGCHQTELRCRWRSWLWRGRRRDARRLGERRAGMRRRASAWATDHTRQLKPT